MYAKCDIILTVADRVCACPDSQCIMAGTSGRPLPTNFSSCSVSDLGMFISSGRDNCLFNTPFVTLEGERCGNGIREGDEACDCGGEGDCTDPCCNPLTCQLANGAQCSLGACCDDNCQFQREGILCRDATGECDIADYCTGSSGECPEDVYVVDGTSCASDMGYCVRGRCPTHREQCLEAWRKFYSSASPVRRCVKEGGCTRIREGLKISGRINRERKRGYVMMRNCKTIA